MILPDHLAPGLRVVFCGTAPGRVSAQRGHYYANSGNGFWGILYTVELVPERLEPDRDAEVLRHGIGLTDLAKHVFGQDADLPADAFDVGGLLQKIAACQPRTLAFTSLTAARAVLGPRVSAGMQAPDPRLQGISLWALPSPSGLARSHFSLAPWQALALHVKGEG